MHKNNFKTKHYVTVSVFFGFFFSNKSSILFFGLLTVIFAYACSLEEGKSRGIRAHTENYEGVEHGFAAIKAQRYCKSCHGSALQGGENGEPSCYTCHGLNWHEEIEADQPRAPSDHSDLKGEFYHNTGSVNAISNCVSCHGTRLTGDSSQLTPSCYLCHQQNWE